MVSKWNLLQKLYFLIFVNFQLCRNSGFLNNTGKRGRALVGQDPLILVIDADSCLHRLYGGSFTDWVCGGQWNSMFHFIDNLARASRSNNMKLIVVFNGSIEKNRIPEWLKQETQTRNTVGQVLGHVHNKGTPPPKAWFIPPVALGTYNMSVFKEIARSIFTFALFLFCIGTDDFTDVASAVQRACTQYIFNERVCRAYESVCVWRECVSISCVRLCVIQKA